MLVACGFSFIDRSKSEDPTGVEARGELPIPCAVPEEALEIPIAHIQQIGSVHLLDRSKLLYAA
jgi:hypothetical protein